MKKLREMRERQVRRQTIRLRMIRRRVVENDERGGFMYERSTTLRRGWRGIRSTTRQVGTSEAPAIGSIEGFTEEENAIFPSTFCLSWRILLPLNDCKWSSTKILACGPCINIRR
eukprot:765260-Hanusia_phi.AAC.12